MVRVDYIQVQYLSYRLLPAIAQYRHQNSALGLKEISPHRFSRQSDCQEPIFLFPVPAFCNQERTNAYRVCLSAPTQFRTVP